MKRRESQHYLKDILDSIEDVKEFTEDLSYNEFIKDKKTINAIIRSIEIIGEATKHIPNRLKLKYPDIPWRKMAGMRDKLIQEYFGIDYEILWQVVKKDLPALRKQIDSLLISEISKNQ